MFASHLFGVGFWVYERLDVCDSDCTIILLNFEKTCMSRKKPFFSFVKPRTIWEENRKKLQFAVMTQALYRFVSMKEKKETGFIKRYDSRLLYVEINPAWIKLNITQVIKKIEIYRSEKKRKKKNQPTKTSRNYVETPSV